MSFQIKFHQIRAFVEVARQGSIRGASRALNLSQPALTKSIKELEEGMAAQLFVRRSKGVALTECGEGFYQRARLILEELRAAQDDIRQRQGELAGQINIGMGASVSRSLMPAVIAFFTICGTRLLWVFFVFPSCRTFPNLLLCYALSWIFAAILLALYYRFYMRHLHA